MKRQIILTVIAIFAVMIILSGCSLGKMGRANSLSNITATPIQQIQPQNNELNQKMDAMIAGLTNLASAIRNGKNAPVITGNNHQLKRPNEGAFSKKKIEAKTSKKYPVSTYDRKTAKEIAALKTRVAQLEDMHPDKGAESVFFPSAKTELSSEAKTWLEENIVERWFNGEIDITAINGYASISKPKIPNMTNMAYAKQRAIAAKQYLVSRGVKLDEVKINIKGPTKRFGNNLNVTVVLDEILDKQEQDKREEGRKQHKTDP